MFRKFTWAFWLIVLLVGAGWLLWRSRELNEVRRTRAVLRQQIEERRGRTDLPATPPSHATPLTREERKQLLTLRGQVGQLRREVMAATERLARLTPSAGTNLPAHRPPPAGLVDPLYDPSEDYGPGLTAAAGEIGHRLYVHAERHGGRLPAELTPDLVSDLSTDAVDLAGRLELLPGEPLTPETDCCIFIAREREARRTADGQWVRLYLVANGQKIFAGPTGNPDWDRWERERLGVLRESLRRRMQPRPAGTSSLSDP